MNEFYVIPRWFLILNQNNGNESGDFGHFENADARR